MSKFVINNENFSDAPHDYTCGSRSGLPCNCHRGAVNEVGRLNERVESLAAQLAAAQAELAQAKTHSERIVKALNDLYERFCPIGQKGDRWVGSLWGEVWGLIQDYRRGLGGGDA